MTKQVAHWVDTLGVLPSLSCLLARENRATRPAWIPGIWVRRAMQRQERSWWYAVCEVPFSRQSPFIGRLR